ncbi:MAG: hypothetical protein ABL949_01740 [Fimbriimonadaceae bacterium]
MPVTTRVLRRSFSAFVLVASLQSGAFAQWTVTLLHPAGAADSAGYGVAGLQQAGQCTVSGAYNACLWNGTSASFVNLHPAGAVESSAFMTTGSKQVGQAKISGFAKAALWTGTAGSFVNLHPTGAVESAAFAAAGNQQAGQAKIGGAFRAGIWSGTAASWSNLHPGSATSSSILDTDGTTQVGEAFVSGAFRASKWNGTAASWVNLHPATATESHAYGVSGSQQMGTAIVGGQYRASVWSGTAASWVDLSPTGSTDSEAFRGGSGMQAGYAIFSGAEHAGIWTGTAASWVDLHAFLPSSFNYSYAQDVSSDGVNIYVVGYGFNTAFNRDEAVLWSKPIGSGFTFALNKSSVAGQNSVLGTITMGATSNTDTVFTTYDNSGLITTPPTATVSAGLLSKSFQITTTAITSTVVTTVYAKLGSLTKSATLTLTPLVPTALSFAPTQVTGGQSTSCRVVINGVAGPGGRLIAMLDDSANATVPSTVTVPAGATSVTFPIPTTAVTTLKTVTVTARVSAGEKTGTFRIAP